MIVTTNEPTKDELDRVAMDNPFPDLDVESRVDYIIKDNQVFLCGSRSVSSGSFAFPQRSVCQITGSKDMEPITVGPDGILYSFSTIHVSATRDVPYSIGYVDFPNGLRVLAQVRDLPDDPTCDISVTLKANANDWWVEPNIQKGSMA